MSASLTIIARDPHLRGRLARAVREHRLLFHAIHEATDFNSGIRILQEQRPHVVLLEMEPNSTAGLDLLRAIQTGSPAIVLFAEDLSCAPDVIRFRPMDLLLKTVEDDQLEQAVANAVEQGSRIYKAAQPPAFLRVPLSDKQIVVKLSNGIAMLYLDHILFLKSNDDLTEIHLCHQPRIVLHRRLKDLEAQLVHEGFVRIHQSYLVNRKHVVRYIRKEGRHSVILSNDQHLPVSREKKDDLINAWMVI